MKNAETLNSQKRLVRWIVIGAGLLCIIIAYLMTSHSKPKLPVQHKVDLPGDRVNPQDLWMTKIDNENRLMENRLKYLENLILEEKKIAHEKDNENMELREEIRRMKTEIKMTSNSQQQNNMPSPLASKPNDPFINVGINYKDQEVIKSFRPILKEMVMGKAKREISNVGKAIPAGTTVKALLVSSVDAPCGVNSSSDPQPVKLRILDDGHLPKEVMAILKGGLVIASTYGDISSERVYMRLESLTKVEENGDFVETSITGFVSGEDGKFGVRGNVVDKSSKLVTNAAFSGFFGGVGQFLNTSMLSTLNNRCCDANPAGWELLEAGGLQGTSAAFDMLAEYYISRAEQIMPVIEVTAGRIVDITFTHKAEMGDLYTKDEVKKIREKTRRKNNG